MKLHKFDRKTFSLVNFAFLSSVLNYSVWFGSQIGSLLSLSQSGRYLIGHRLTEQQRQHYGIPHKRANQWEEDDTIIVSWLEDGAFSDVAAFSHLPQHLMWETSGNNKMPQRGEGSFEIIEAMCD